MCIDTSAFLFSNTHDSERAYFGDLAGVPRFDRDRETELACAVVATRRAYWSILLDPTHFAKVVEIIVAHAKDEAVLAVATDLRGGGDAAPLAAALDRAGDEHAAADAIVATAAGIDRDWHAEAQRARARYLRARNRFVEANLRLVVAFASRHGGYLLPLVDRIQEGNIGLMKAVDRFDPGRGVRFSTYASWWIRHAITRAVTLGRGTVRTPAHVHAARYEAHHDSDIVESLSDDTSLAALEHVADDRDRERAVTALGGLPAREQAILRERYGFPGAPRATLKEIGRRHGVSRERARQIQRGALDQLRRALEPKAARVR